MKAVVLHEYGGPEKLRFEDNVPEPQMSGGTVLIAAADAGPGDGFEDAAGADTADDVIGGVTEDDVAGGVPGDAPDGPEHNILRRNSGRDDAAGAGVDQELGFQRREREERDEKAHAVVLSGTRYVNTVSLTVRHALNRDGASRNRRNEKDSIGSAPAEGWCGATESSGRSTSDRIH